MHGSDIEFERDCEEKLIPMMEISGTGAATEERIVAIEKKLRDMEALVKGLTQELLDLKSVAMKMAKTTEEGRRAELKRAQPGAQGAQQQTVTPAVTPGSPSTVVMRKGTKPSDSPAATPEPAMDMIMQTDGTMKLEPRRGNKEYIVASAGYGRNKKGTAKGKQNDLIYAAEENKKDPAKK